MLITPANTLKTQYEFSTLSPAKYKHPGLIGGFGSGKTRAIALRWLSLIEYRAKNQKIKAKLMIVEPTKEMIRDILVESLNEFFDEHNIPHTYHKTYHNYTIRYRKEFFTALLRSSDSPASLTGKNLTDIILDEYDKKHSITHQKDVWTECISRIRMAADGTVGVVTTPEGYKNTFELWGECDYREKKNFKLIRAKTYDNKFLPPDFVENLYDQFSAELVKQYIEAQFVNLTQGKVYYAWDRDKNNTTRKYDKNLELELNVDFNLNPMKWCFSHRIGDNVYVIDELIKNNTYTEEMAKAVGDKYGYDARYVVYGDYTGSYGDTTSRTTDFNIIKDILPNVDLRIKPNPLEVDRINAVNSRLCNSRELRRLFVNVQACPNVVKDFEQVIWKEGSREIDKKTNSDLTHISDAIGYRINYDFSLKGKITSTVRRAF